MPDVALQRLIDGNRRYVVNRSAPDLSPLRRIEVAQEQKPFATILGCVDSRVPPEQIFDQGLGELLVIRTAGEVLDQAALGSLEFGVAELRIPLLVVLGHERCGAVKIAIDTLERKANAEGAMAYLVQSLAPAVEQGQRLKGDLWEQSARVQVMMQVEQLKRSPIMSAAIQRGALKIVGAWYRLVTGFVDFLDG